VTAGEFDPFFSEHAAMRDLEIARREVHHNQAVEQRRANDEERERVFAALEAAQLYFGENEAERSDDPDRSGWGADDLKNPPARWEVEAELDSVPLPLGVASADEYLLVNGPLAEGRPEPLEQPPDDDARGVLVRFAHVEKAVQLRTRDGLGRGKLMAAVPGLGDWGARAILVCVKAGKPLGLWLDDDDQLRWGAAISPVWGREQNLEQLEQAIAPAPGWLRLPRP
jgi:hypothetical protein